MKSVAVFGGGIAGLTVCHELLKKGYNVSLYEKEKDVGGVSKSRYNENNIPSEYSWRGYPAIYENLFTLIKEIPITENTTVYDNLSGPIDFYLPRDEIIEKYNYNPKGNWKDFILGSYYVLRSIFSDKRREVYAKMSFKESMLSYKNFSRDAYARFITMLCPGLGIDENKGSVQNVAKVKEMEFLNKVPKDLERMCWYVMNAPTNQAWFDIWLEYLKEKGLKVHLNNEIKGVFNINNKIVSCSTFDKNTYQMIDITADDYVFCLDPYAMRKIILNNDLDLSDDCFNKIIKLSNDKHQVQIGFVLAFDKKVIIPHIPGKTWALAMPDSEFNITLYFQEHFWDINDKLNKDVKSIWSGTVCKAYKKGKLYGKTAESLTQEELLEEIKHQIFRSEELKKLINDNNDYNIDELTPIHEEIWNEWEFNPETKKLEIRNKKWVTDLKNYHWRPYNNTNLENMYLAGAHMKTSMDLYSMEGAVESGKRATNMILEKNEDEKCYLYDHGSPFYLRFIQKIDNLLYRYKLPNILDMMIFPPLVVYFIKKYL